MKKKILSTLMLLAIVLFPLFTVGQMLGPENPGGAPIGSGSLILLGLAAAYGGKKWHDLNKEELEE